MSTRADHSRRPWVVALAGLSTVEVLATIVGAVATGLPFGTARDSFLVTNATLGAACAVSGGLIAWHRPRNAVGWLLLGVAVAQTATAAVTPWLAAALRAQSATDVPATVYNGGWPWAVGLFLPLALWFFPDGRLPGRPWRWALPLVVLNGVVQVLLFSADPYPLITAAGYGPAEVPPAWSRLAVPGLAADGWFAVSDAVLVATYLAGAVGLLVRYRRGDEPTRLQLLWPLLATAVTAVLIGGSRVGGGFESTGFPVLATLAVALIPASVAVAILRYRLLDIRLIWSRAVTYGLLSAAVAGVYVGLVELVSRWVRDEAELLPAIAATLVVAAGFNPVRVRLQRVVDRWVYGDRHDPVRAASAVTRALAAGADRPPDVLPAVCEALRLPWAALVVDGVVTGEHGRSADRVESIPLRRAGETVAELRVGVRAGQRRLDQADRSVLELMALPIGVAVHAEALSAAIGRSRRAIVTARELERRRIRRDLHDGLASVLTGVAFQADAVVTVAATDAARAAELAEDIRAGVTGAIADVRRLINELHPAVLHDHGLVDAVRRHARRLAGDGTLQVRVSGDGVDELPAAVEVAAYRILVEALTNVARHATATRAEVDIRRSGDELLLSVRDDGPPGPPWTPGVGLRSIAERAEELGGLVQATPSAQGGRVEARLPLPTAVERAVTR